MLNKKFIVFLALILSLSYPFHPVVLGAETGNRKPANSWCLDMIDAEKDVKAGKHTVKIAVIDSGVKSDNPYLRKDHIASGYNYVLRNTAVDDLIGHGTQIAGIIAGGSTESRELAGIGSNFDIVPLVCITKCPDGVLANGGVPALCAAIKDAVNVYGCRIINISSGISSDDPELSAAIAYAEEKGVIVISAVGNDNQSASDKIFYPAAYETVVGVGSVNSDGKVSEFSQRNESVMVTAPGEKVYSVSPVSSNDLVQVNGTSYAAAFVSRFAAILLSKYPNMTPKEFREVLKNSSRDSGDPGYDTSYGYGIISLSRGLSVCRKE